MAQKLGEYLVQEGLLAAPQLTQALEAQRRNGGTLGNHLVALGFLDEDTLARALARISGLPAASRADLLHASSEIVGLLSADFARRHRALPFRVEGERLLLALEDPADTAALDEAAFLTGFSIAAHIAPEAALRAALERHHGRAPGGAAVAAVAEAPPAPAPSPVPEPEGPAAPGPRPPHGQDVEAAAASWAEIGRRLASASGRDAVLEIAADAVALLQPRVLVFALRGDEAVAVATRGLPPRAPRQVAVPLSEPGVIGPALGGRLQYGPIHLGPPERDFYTLLGGRAPTAALVVPIALRGKTVLVLYGDDPAAVAPPPTLEDARRLASLVGAGVEVAVLRARILREAGAV